jgi:hypothetical protein
MSELDLMKSATVMTLASVSDVVRSAILATPISDMELGVNEGLRRALMLIELYKETFTKQATPTESEVQDDKDDEPVCEDCEGDGWVYKRIDVDAEKRVPCECQDLSD